VLPDSNFGTEELFKADMQERKGERYCSLR
jgi:hypothetical protein